MEKSNRNLLLIIGGIALIACACIGIFALAGTGLLLRNIYAPDSSLVDETVSGTTPLAPSRPTSITDSTPAQTDPTASPPTEGVPPSTTESTTDPGSDLPSEITRQMDEIHKQVVTIRGLQPGGSVERALLTPEQLRQHVTNDFLDDYPDEEAKEDAIVLSLFGLLEPDFDLRGFYQELYSEQVAGFYDDETKEMYVVKGEGFEGPERLTYAHEYTHVLQDQTYNFNKGLNFNDEACESETERCAALQALIEGDASASELQWFTEYGTQADLLQIQEFYSNYKSPIFDNAPSFMREDFIFPYTYGQTFVENLRTRGGWDAVNQAYKNPPQSTEQILHPEDYPNDNPVKVTLPDFLPVLGEGWREIDRNVMGEWYTFLLLAHGIQENTRVEASSAQSSAAGWAGDQYVAYHNNSTGEDVLVLHTLWDTPAEAKDFARTFIKYGNERFGVEASTSQNASIWETPKVTSEFRIDGKETSWVLAPNADILKSVSESLQQ